MSKSKRRRHIKTNVIYTTNGAVNTLRPVAKSCSTLTAERRIMLERRHEQLAAMPSSSRAVASMLVVSHGAAPDEGVAPGYIQLWDGDMDWEDTQPTAPDLSHEGGEYQDIYEHLLTQRQASRKSRRIDLRTRRDRLRAVQRNWSDQLPALTNAYLQWKHASVLDTSEAAAPENSHEFHITALWTHQRIDGFPVIQHPEELANAALIRHGLLGCTPIVPSVAISLQALELYHRLRRRHAQLSVQPMVRALCDIYDTNYTTVLREQFSAAFDVYLEILRRVRDLINDTLGHNTPEWRATHACPCCHLKLENEVPLYPERLVAMDGNNSAKRIASAGSEDERIFKSDYFLSRDDVDHFKDEVKRKTTVTNAPVESELEEEDAPWLSEDAPGEAPDGQAQATPCTQRWKASAAEHEKRALDIYESTGIFVSACRHGLIQKACEMIRSGELAKYPLGITNWLIDVHGRGTGCGYDIGCAFKETANNSDRLGPKVRDNKIEFVVCAFHGYAHNRLCQLANHPLYRVGFGIEDLEEMERVFSGSNSVARGIRHASQFHYHQFLDLHFMQWDEDRYGQLSRFLYNNYRQCFTIIKDFSVDVAHLKHSLNLDEKAIESWLSDEQNFLQNLKDEPEDRVLECAYVQALLDRQHAEQKLGDARDAFISTPANSGVDTRADIRMTRRLERARHAAQEAAYAAIQAVNDLEIKLEIDERWTPANPKYQKTLKFMHNRDFHRALEKVQQLVVQRLLEMSKAHMTGMGYKMRTSIWKSLKARGSAIRTALNKYNTLALQMSPPAPTLEWKDVVNYTFISEFDLLRHSHGQTDVLKKPWTVPYNREVAAKYWKIRGAYDELKRLNVELGRLHTHTKVQDAEFIDAIQRVCDVNAPLAAELRCEHRKFSRVNKIHLQRIHAIGQLDGFTGSLSVGIPCEPHLAELLKLQTAPSSDSENASTRDDAYDEPVDEDDEDDAIVKMTDFLEDLAIAG